MPQGQKRKRHAQEKHRQAWGETQRLKGAQATEAAAAAEREESSSSPASVFRGTPLSSPAAGTRQEPQGAPATSSLAAGVSCPRSEEGAQSQDEKSASTAQAAPSVHSTYINPLTRKVCKLVQFLLDKYKTKEPIPKATLLKIVNKTYNKHFPAILRRASECVELVFGLDLKEVDSSSHSYTLISKLGLCSEGSLTDVSGLPVSGFLMTLLGMIFKKGNRATEEEFWDFLSALGVYAGRSHSIFGEPRRFIRDIVQLKYLTYSQVPNSDPPHYEFLWGPRAHAETSKMKVLEYMAKLTDTVPRALPDLYEEAMKDEVERARVRAAARAAAIAERRARSRAKAHSSSTCREGGRGQIAHFVLEESSQAPK